jgi:hypothetical protein
MCEVISGYNRPLCKSTGGIDKVVVYNLQNRDAYTINADETEVTALSLVAGKYGYMIDLEPQLSTAEDNGTGSRENQTWFVDQMVEMVLNDNRKETRNFINTLGRSTTLGMIVRDQDGVWRHFGLEYGLTMESTASVLGRAMGDRNGSTNTFVGQEKYLAPEIAAGLVTAILAPDPS